MCIPAFNVTQSYTHFIDSPMFSQFYTRMPEQVDILRNSSIYTKNNICIFIHHIIKELMYKRKAAWIGHCKLRTLFFFPFLTASSQQNSNLIGRIKINAYRLFSASWTVRLRVKDYTHSNTIYGIRLAQATRGSLKFISLVYISLN